MIKYLVPFLLTDRSQIPEALIKRHDFGLEGILFDGLNLQSPMVFKRIVKNIQEVRKRFPGSLVSIHFPTDNANYLDDHRFRNLLYSYLDLAANEGIEKVILHSNYIQPLHKFDPEKLPLIRKKMLAFYGKLDRYLEGKPVKVAIENMPVIGNDGTDFDSIFVYPQDFKGFSKFKNIYINWDFGHWAFTNKMVEAANFLAQNKKIKFNDYRTIQGQIIHYHFSSFAGLAFPGAKGYNNEGITPARGDFSEQVLARCLSGLKRTRALYHVSLEIQDANYQKRKNLEITIGWLKNHKLL